LIESQEVAFNTMISKQFFLLALLAVAGCASSTSSINDYLDPLTAVTVSYAKVPLVMYRDVSGHAAYARDYVHAGPIQVNRAGSFRYYLWVGIWSTLQDVDMFERRDGFESIVIFADGEPLQLDIAGWTADAIGASEAAYQKPVASAADAYYEVTMDQIRLLGEASNVQLRTTGSKPESYEPWDDQRSAKNSIAAFVRYTAF
jgi:hypothetical protein